MEKKIKIAFLGLVLIGLITGGLALAEPPTMPHRFWGDVTINDVKNLSNWQIVAVIDNQQVAIANIVSGYYDFNVPGETGEIISFYIKETGKDTTYDTTITYLFGAGEITELDLAVTVNCAYGEWQNIGCGQGGCQSTQMRQQKTSTVSLAVCPTLSQCTASSSCQSGGGGYSGGGGAAPSDTTAPSISNIIATPAANSATITWTTNESSISWVVYGVTTSYGKEFMTTTYTTSHSVNLTGLTPKTTYHYQVKSKDSYGNIGTAVDKTFTTLNEGKTPTQGKEGEQRGEGENQSQTGTITGLPFTIDKPLNQMNRQELILVVLKLIIYLISQGKLVI